MATPDFVSYSVDNDKRFQKALNEAREGITDLRIPFTLIAADFYRSQAAIFGLNGPGQYPDLSEAYKRRKQALVGFVYPILKKSGALEVAASVQKGPGNITTITPSELQMGVDGNTITYALFHQSDAPRSKIPLRKFLFIGPESKFASNEQKGRLERWINILNENVAAIARQKGFG